MSEEPAPPYDSSDPEQVKRAKGAKKQEDQLDMAAVRAILRHPDGQRFMVKLLTHCRLFQSSADGTMNVMVAEGVRLVGTTLLELCKQADEKSLVAILADVVGRGKPPTK